MQTITGKYTTANIFIDEIDETTREQILTMVNHPAFKGTYMAIMPDCHAGKGCVIGTTMRMNDYIIPNIVGVDIGCGVETYNLGKMNSIDLQGLDEFIKNNIPSGHQLNKNTENWEAVGIDLQYNVLDIINKLDLDEEKVAKSLGSLGGGNHFIELNIDSKENIWLTIHSGSRNFGLKVAQYHQDKAKTLMKKMLIPEDLFKGSEFLPIDMGGSEYLEDMQIAQQFAKANRKFMANKIIESGFFVNNGVCKTIRSVHNYINFNDNIIRKGAIQANAGQEVVIPFNQQDGIAIGIGLGSSKYNYSAPHGAGRVYSRTKAKE